MNKTILDLKTNFLYLSDHNVDLKGKLILKIKSELESTGESHLLEEWCVNNLKISSVTFKNYLYRSLYLQEKENDLNRIKKLDLKLSYFISNPNNKDHPAVDLILNGNIRTAKQLSQYLKENKKV